MVRISHGLKKLATDSRNKEDDNNEQETFEKTETFALKTGVEARNDFWSFSGDFI